jgi:hypothetical protein
LLMCPGRNWPSVEESRVRFLFLEVHHEFATKRRAGCAMTAVRTGGEAPAVLKPPADLRRMSRFLFAVLLPVGPAAVAVQRFVLPYRTTDGPEAVVAKVAVDPQAQSLLLWLALIGLLTLVPGVLGVARLTRRRAPRTTAAAVLLLVPAYLSMGWLVGSDVLLWVGVRVGVDQPTWSGCTARIIRPPWSPRRCSCWATSWAQLFSESLCGGPAPCHGGQRS